MKGSIGIDLLSVGWLNSGMKFYYYLLSTPYYWLFSAPRKRRNAPNESKSTLSSTTKRQRMDSISICRASATEGQNAIFEGMLD